MPFFTVSLYPANAFLHNYVVHERAEVHAGKLAGPELREDIKQLPYYMLWSGPNVRKYTLFRMMEPPA